MSSRSLLKGKVCLITGTSRGIGREIAERFSEEGAIVYANAREKNSIDEWAVGCSLKYQTDVVPLYFDVTDYNSVKAGVMQLISERKRLDVLVNNAGLVTYEVLGMIQIESLRKMLEVNVVAVINLIQTVSRLMSRQKSGSIINISSIVGVKGVKGQMAYSATKGAVVSLTKSAAKELASQNVRVNALAPGMVDTERFRRILEENFREKITSIGMGRMAKPLDVANACVFLGSDLSGYITGQIIEIDGSTVI